MAEMTDEEKALQRFQPDSGGAVYWHKNGKPYSRRDYIKRGIKPPPRHVIEQYMRDEAVRRRAANR